MKLNMKKKTIIILSLSLVFVLLAVAVIATFPTYLLEDIEIKRANEKYIQNPNTSTHTGPEEQGPDIGYVGDSEYAGPSVEAVLPTIDDSDDSSVITNDQLLGYNTIVKIASAEIKAEGNAFVDGAKASLTKLGYLDKKYYRARHYVRSFYNRFEAYDYSATKDGKNYQPEGKVKIIITIPKEYDLNKTSIYYLFNNSVQELDCTLNKSNRTISAPVVSSGVYVLVESKPDSNSSSSGNSSADKNNSSDNASSNNSSTPSQNQGNTSSGNASGNTSSTLPPANKDSMDGYSPWR